MLSFNLKRKIAVLLTGAMVLGMTVTAAAADPVTVNGTGESEGHVNKRVIEVTFPTEAANENTFDYKLDAEGLIAATTHAKYPNVTFPEGNADKHVYFSVGEDEYACASKALSVSNNSSVSINVTVKVDVETKDTDVALVSQGQIDKVKDPSVYLGLCVGNEKKAIKAGSTEISVSLNKCADYSISYNSTDGYIYERDKDAAIAAGCKTQFSIEGETKVVDSAAGKTAPALKVTWKYDAAGGDTPGGDTPAAGKAPSVAKTSYTKAELAGDSGKAKFDVDYGTGSLAGTEITKVWFSADGTTFKAFSSTNTPTIDNEGHSFSINKTYFKEMSAKRWIRAYFDGSDTKYVEITVTP